MTAVWIIIAVFVVVVVVLAVCWAEAGKKPIGFGGPDLTAERERDKAALQARLLFVVETAAADLKRLGVTVRDAQEAFDAMRGLLEETKLKEVNPAMVYSCGDEPGPCSIPRDEHPEDFEDRRWRARKAADDG